MKRTLLFVAAATWFGLASSHAELSEVTIARQASIGHLPLIVMEDLKLFEKHAQALGLPGVKAQYVTLGGGSAMNDGILSGSIQFAAGGVPPLILLWSKTAGTDREVRAVTALSSMPLLLNTNKPGIKSIADFTAKDRIALPAAQISIQALILKLAAEKRFGAGSESKLDGLTVSLSHPDGAAALLSGTEVTGHFTASPYQELEKRDPRIHTVLNSYDVMGVPATFTIAWSTEAFKKANPTLFRAFVEAVDDAIDIINKDKRTAADIYMRLQKDAADQTLLYRIVNDQQVIFTKRPIGISVYYELMKRFKLVKDNGRRWESMFFPGRA